MAASTKSQSACAADCLFVGCACEMPVCSLAPFWSRSGRYPISGFALFESILTLAILSVTVAGSIWPYGDDCL